MRLPINFNRQVRGHRSGNIVPNFSCSWLASSILLSSYIWVVLLLTWTFIDGANLDQAKATLPPLIGQVFTLPHQPNLSITAASLVNSTKHDKTDKSVPPQLSLTSTASTSANGVTISDTNQVANYRSTVDGSQSNSEINVIITTLSPPHVSSRKIDSNQFAQKQENVPSTTSDIVTAPQDDIHKTFLLMCSAHSILFWSLSCQVHSTSTLLSHTGSRSSSIPYGITSIAIWRPADQLGALVELVWFDVAEKQFHRAAIQRQHATNCDYLLGIEFNQTLDYRSNPFANQSDTFLKEKLVKLAIDSRNQLLFASNYIQNRVDVYRLDSATAANNEMVWLASLDAHHPVDISLDQNEKTVFWVESYKRICHLQYNFEDEHFLQMNRNLSQLKVCTEELSTALPQTIALDNVNKKIIWGSKDGKLYRDGYHMKNINYTEIIGRTPDEIGVQNLAFIGNDTLYLSDEHLVRAFHMDTGKFDLVSVASNTLFDLLLVDNLILTSTLEYSDAITVSSSSWTTTTARSTKGAHFSDFPSAQPNETDSITLPESNHSPMTTTLLITLVPLILVLVIVCAIYIVFQKNRPKFSPNSCTSRLFFLPNRLSHYNQLRKNRANSTGRDELIVAGDIEQHQHTNETLYEPDGLLPGSGQRPATRAPHHGQHYRQNIIRQSSMIDDIEDIFGNGLNHHHHRGPPTCIACRDSDICQDKGICMATYRVL